MNKQCVMTVVTADMFQLYVPLFVRCVHGWGGDDVDTAIFIRGETCRAVRDSMAIVAGSGAEDRIFDGFCVMYPYHESTTNSLRFTESNDVLEQYEQVLITDIDLLLFKNPFLYLAECMALSGQPFAAHHGPYRKPHRPDVCEEWKGDFERVAGGFVLVTPDWYARTRAARKLKSALLLHSHVGRFRENDEVLLAQIIKDSGMKTPASKYFPAALRGLHLGDFKPSMNHRWQNMAKMKAILTDENCMNYLSINNDPAWCDIVNMLCGESEEFKMIIANVKRHLAQRGFNG